MPDFVCSARRYWLGVFPRVTVELRRWRARANRIPDPVLRQLALRALEQKRGNVEGAAAFAALVSAANRPTVVRALVSCQLMCDYLDLVSEQPNPDPVANGYRLHEALIVATAPGETHRDYYAEHGSGEDGGYLRAMVQSLRGALTALPSVAAVAEPLGSAAERVALYQSFNHGDADGSFQPFDRWAARTSAGHTDLHPWESAAGAGSTLAVLAMIAAAADPALRPSVANDIEAAYFPWIGSLHSLLDSLVDHREDMAVEGRALIAYYHSARHAADRMGELASEALRRALGLPQGRRHALIVAAMASYYMCELDRSSSVHAELVAPAVLEALGGLAAPNMALLSARRSLRRSPRSSECDRRLLASGASH